MARRPSRSIPAVLRRAVAVVLVVTSIVAVAVAVRADPAAATQGARHHPPVDAPVVDPFRAPASEWGAGNRGLTYDLAPGTSVRATAAGEVVFAGWVAGTRHVTVRHADGLRTSYSFLDSIRVRRGQRVAGGEVVGTAGEGFHLGARVGDTYIDPSTLFAAVRIEVRLVPHTEPAPPTDDGLLRERIALEQVVRERGLFERGVRWLADRGVEARDAVLAAGRVVMDLDWRDATFEAVVAIIDSLLEPCTPVDAEITPPPATGRVALLVGGLGSSSHDAAIDDVDLATLGYLADDVVRFAYGGGRIPDPDGSLHPALASLRARPYAPADTGVDLVDQGRHLADLIEQAAAARPGDPIDVYAHSMGGLVVRTALEHLAHRPGVLDALGTVVTIATPHQGADLATIVPLLDVGEQLDVALAGPLLGFEVSIDAPALRQLAESSDLVHRLRRDGVPAGVDLRTIGARGDPIVTADKTRVDGHAGVVLDPVGPWAHDELPGDPATTRELQLALAGAPPGCRGFVDRVLDGVVPEAIAWGENLAIAVKQVADG